MSQTVLLGDVIKSVSDTFKFTDQPVIFLNTSDIESGKILNNEKRAPIGLPGQAKKKIKKGDILLSEIRPANRRFAFIDFDAPDHVVSTKLMVLRAKGGAHPRFVYHWLTSTHRLEYLQMLAESRSGTFPQITFDTIKNIKLDLPEYSEQEKVVQFIDTIDQKIELNKKMNETLEQMGQALFKHYFIDNPEATKWEKTKFSEFADIFTGKGSTKSKLADGGPYPLYGANGIMGTSDEYLVDDNLIITGRVGSLGNVRAIKGKVWLSDNVLYFNPRKEYFGFVYLTAKNFDYKSLNRGSTQPLITQTDIKNKVVLRPDKESMDSFESQYGYLLKKIQANESEIFNLSAIRDSLLPRLISGKIRLDQ